MNSIALLAAKVSNKTIEDGIGIFSDKAAIIIFSPESFALLPRYLFPTNFQIQLRESITYRIRTVLVGIYHTDKQISTYNIHVSYRKKY